MKIIGIIPARKESKRLKNKNTYPLKGKPLIEYTIDAALKSKYLSKENIYVSTDFIEVIEICNRRGIRFLKRSSELAKDGVWTQEVVNDVDSKIGGLDEEDIIIILQANSPQMTPEVIDTSIEMLCVYDLWQVHTVDEKMINNGAIHVMRRKVRNHKGKANYNGIIKTNWVDVHTEEDIELLNNLL